MKVCPVCEMEEEDDALSCSMCGSDFEAESTTQEIVNEEPSSEEDNNLSEIEEALAKVPLLVYANK